MILKSCVRLVLVALFVSSFVACKKDTCGTCQPKERSEELRLKDSVYYYYNTYSLWSDDSIPDYEIPGQFTDAFQSSADVLSALKNKTPYYSGYNGPIDRFSYMVNAVTSTGNTAIDLQSGLGIYAAIGAVSDSLAYPVIYFVEPGSAAANKGIRRSDIIKNLGEKVDLSLAVKCSEGACTVLDGTRYSQVISLVYDALNSEAVDLTILRNETQQLHYALQATDYEIAAFYKDTVFTFPEKRIGYLGISTFADVESSVKNQQAFEQVFKRFEQANIEDLIVDMRYNTGGYVATASYLANKVIPAAFDGKLMFTYAVNAYFENKKTEADSPFAPVYFKRQNALALKKVYFLVSESTASAAELYMNILKAYMPVFIIAEKTHTYGKPVGFFPQTIMNKVDLWVASFKLVNASGETDYWNGIPANQGNVEDYIFKDFGDSQETMTATALDLALAKGLNKIGASKIHKMGRSAEKITLKKINTLPIRKLLK